jgi:hypothetical protein
MNKVHIAQSQRAVLWRHFLAADIWQEVPGQNINTAFRWNAFDRGAWLLPTLFRYAEPKTNRHDVTKGSLCLLREGHKDAKAQRAAKAPQETRRSDGTQIGWGIWLLPTLFRYAELKTHCSDGTKGGSQNFFATIHKYDVMWARDRQNP